MNTPKQQINTEHPRIKNRDPQEQSTSNELVNTLTQEEREAEKKFEQEKNNYLRIIKTRCRPVPASYENPGWTWMIFNLPSAFKQDRDIILALIDSFGWGWIKGRHPAGDILEFIPMKLRLDEEFAFTLLAKIPDIDLLIRNCGFGKDKTPIRGKNKEMTMKLLNLPNMGDVSATTTDRIRQFGIDDSLLIDKDVVHKLLTLCEKGYKPYVAGAILKIITENKDTLKVDEAVLVSLLSVIRPHEVPGQFKEQYKKLILNPDIIGNMIMSNDDISSFKNIHFENIVNNFNKELLDNNMFILKLLCIDAKLYDKIDNPNKAFIKKMLGKLQGNNLGSIDIDSAHGVVSYIEGTVRDTGAGMEYGNYVRAIYNGEEKQTHVVYRDGYSSSKDNRDLCFDGTEIVAVETTGDKVVVTVKAKKGDTFSRDYTFTFTKGKEDSTPILDETEQAEFLELVEKTKSQIIQSETGKYDGCTMTPHFKSEKINAEKGVAVVVLYKQIDCSAVPSMGNQYAYEAIRINKDGSNSRIAYKAARDYDRKAGNNIVLDAQDYTL